MNKFPTPPPDRRLEVKKNTYNKTNTDPNTITEGNTAFIGNEDVQKYNNLNLLRIKHIEDMRKNILTYKVKKVKLI